MLRQKAAEVPQVDRSVRKLMKDMTDTMRDAPGLGLAANQVGILRRVIVWANEDDRGALANPVILDKGGQNEDEEGCLSLPGLKFPVVRAQWVRVQGLNEMGAPIVIEAEDLTARIFQHEIDHIDGILFLDHLSAELQREARRRLREEALK